MEQEPRGEQEQHPVWQVEIGENNQIEGLPEDVKPKDVMLFLGPDNKWYAQNPSEEVLEEIQLWRSDWNEPER